MRTGGIRLIYSIIRTVFLSFRCIPTTFGKLIYLWALAQLITLKAAFREEYVIEDLIVIARWNWDENTYMMGWLDMSFSDLRRHGS